MTTNHLITVGFILTAAGMFNALRHGTFRKWFPIILILFAVLFLTGFFYSTFIKTEPFTKKIAWIPILKNGDTYYFAYKDLEDKNHTVTFFYSNDPKSYPKKVIVEKNYFGITTRKVDFDGAYQFKQ